MKILLFILCLGAASLLTTTSEAQDGYVSQRVCENGQCRTVRVRVGESFLFKPIVNTTRTVLNRDRSLRMRWRTH